MKNVTLLSTGCLMAALFWGCPTQPKTPPRVEMLEELKDYTLFKEGSYWIYKDSLSNDMDFVYVLNTKDFEVTDDEVYGNCTVSGTNVNFHSSFYQKDFIQGFAVFCRHPNQQWVYVNNEQSDVFFCCSYYENDVTI